VRIVPGADAEVVLANYIQDGSARAGPNIVAVRVERAGGLDPGQSFAALERCTAVGATHAQPDEIVIEGPQGLRFAAGQPIEIPYTVRRRGGWPDAASAVTVTSTGAGVRLLSPPRTSFARIGAGVHGAVRLRADRIGRYEISISVPRIYNAPSWPVELEVVNGSRPGGEDRRALRAGIAAAAAASAILVLGSVARRLRRRRRS
jgi:hypothetical protein